MYVNGGSWDGRKEVTSIIRDTVAGRPVMLSMAEGKPLILLTRMASANVGLWQGVWDWLAERFSIATIGFDLPEPDEMDDPVAVFSRLAEQCVAVARELGHERFHMFGWNAGTHIALRALLNHPEKVQSAMLLAPFFEKPDMRATDKLLAFRRCILEHHDRELYSYYWFMGALSPDYVDSHFEKVEEMALNRAASDEFVKHGVDKIMRWEHVVQRHWATDAELGASQVPTLVVGIDRNTWNAGPTGWMAKELGARLGEAETVLLPQATSLVLLEAPEVFIRAASPFLTRLDQKK